MTNIIKIGNSQGIRIPKYLIKEAKLENASIDLVLTKNGLLLKPIQKGTLRQGWDKPLSDTQESLESDFSKLDLENLWEW